MKTSFFTLIFLGIILVCQTGRAAISSIHEPSESHGPPLSQPLFTFEPQDLQRLSDSGFDFAGILHGKGPSNAELYSSSGLPSLARVISADLEIENLEAALRNSEYQGNVQILKMDWLTSADHGFTLVGVVARPDRVTANPEGCGEIRFIYRLSKLRSAEPSADGRFLPMTAMAVFDARQLLKLKTCKEIGKLLTKGRPKSGQLADSILSTARSPRDLPKRIEINALASLWPYTSREQTADQARYVLRVFEFEIHRASLKTLNRFFENRNQSSEYVWEAWFCPRNSSLKSRSRYRLMAGPD
ncbi:MAG: hypothetical protein NTV34_19440 [Proteobacteria bacterium]|nr:hypothetical protein [Pseudomonadota bacterium]